MAEHRSSKGSCRGLTGDGLSPAAEEAVDAPHCLVYPYLPAGLPENEWWVCRSGGGLQWHCQRRLGDKGWWGQPTCWNGHSLAHTPRRAQMQQLLARAQHLYMHMRQSSYSTGREQTTEDPRDLHTGEDGAPACNSLHFRWVMDKRPLFTQCEANCLQILSFIFTHHSLTNCPKYHISKKRLSET